MQLLKSRHEYKDFLKRVYNLDNPIEMLRELCKNDLYFLLRYALNRKDIEADYRSEEANDWLFNQIRAVQAEPDDMLDLWAREHYKSTVITYALTIQEIIKNPEITACIFSHTRPIAKGFLRQIKRELEMNENLKEWFPEIFYQNPQKEAVKWSEDDGIMVKRKSNPKEATLEAWGVVDGQPTSKHYSLLIYDDIVTKESVTSPEMIEKTTDALALSYNLGANGGRRRFIGTRYHYNDTYRIIMERGTANPRIHPATDDGTITGNSVFLTQEQLLKKYADFGSYTFSCFIGSTKVLLSDFTEKEIKDIVVGDEVVGYIFPSKKNSRVSIARSRVVAIQSNKKEVVRITFKSGRVITCTPDHKFYTGRRGSDTGGNDNHHSYKEISKLKRAISLYDPRLISGYNEERKAAWLAGIFDGEGAVSGNCIHIHQSHEHNPDVCDRIESILTDLGFDYGAFNNESGYRNGCNHKEATDYYIRGGLSEKIRFLNVCNPVRSYKIIDNIYEHGTRFLGKKDSDPVVSIESLGIDTTYNIQTDTGNYIANGYAVKNCQMLQNPLADSSQGFKREWLRFFENPPRDCVWYLLVDAANGKRKGNDYTSMWAVGLSADGNMYAIPEVRDKLNLTERAKRLIDLHRKYHPVEVRYEQYGMMADIAHLMTEQEAQSYRFSVIEVGGSMPKNDRIKRMVPGFENFHIYMPRKWMVTDHEGKLRDLIHDFTEEEYLAFPVPAHDDMLDCLSRIEDVEGKVHGTDKKIELTLKWPKPNPFPSKPREKRDWRL